jgi:hypothetical protein
MFQARYETDSSMMMKATCKRKIVEPNGNFHAGYIYADGEHLHKTGITGGKRLMLLFLIVFMIFMAIANLMVSIDRVF